MKVTQMIKVTKVIGVILVGAALPLSVTQLNNLWTGYHLTSGLYYCLQ